MSDQARKHIIRIAGFLILLLAVVAAILPAEREMPGRIIVGALLLAAGAIELAATAARRIHKPSAAIAGAATVLAGHPPGRRSQRRLLPSAQHGDPVAGGSRGRPRLCCEPLPSAAARLVHPDGGNGFPAGRHAAGRPAGRTGRRGPVRAHERDRRHLSPGSSRRASSRRGPSSSPLRRSRPASARIQRRPERSRVLRGYFVAAYGLSRPKGDRVDGQKGDEDGRRIHQESSEEEQRVRRIAVERALARPDLRRGPARAILSTLSSSFSRARWSSTCSPWAQRLRWPRSPSIVPAAPRAPWTHAGPRRR